MASGWSNEKGNVLLESGEIECSRDGTGAKTSIRLDNEGRTQRNMDSGKEASYIMP